MLLPNKIKSPLSLAFSSVMIPSYQQLSMVKPLYEWGGRGMSRV